MPNMNYHLALLLLLCTSGTSNSVILVFEAENLFVSKDPIKLRVGGDAGYFHVTIQYKNRHTWVVSMDSYQQTLTYLCHVTLLEKSGVKTDVGSFEAFNAAWLEDSFSSLDPDQTIKIVWNVFELCATTKLGPEIGNKTISHRWLRIKFAVLNNFNAEVELCALSGSGSGSTVKRETVPKGRHLYWTHFVTSKTRHFKYQLKASKVITRSLTQEIGTVDFFSSDTIDSQLLEQVKTLESWWAVNGSGIQNYDPTTGKYSRKNLRWLSLKTWSFDETDEGAYEQGRNGRTGRKRRRTGS